MKNIPIDNFDCRLSKYPYKKQFKRSTQIDHSITCSCYICTVCNTSARWHKPMSLRWDKLITKYPYTKQFTWSPKSDHSLTCSCYTICALYKHLREDGIKPGVWGGTNWLQRELILSVSDNPPKDKTEGIIIIYGKGGQTFREMRWYNFFHLPSAPHDWT